MKHIFSYFLLCSLAHGVFAQGSVGINTTQPDQSAVLEIYSRDHGFLPPRMTLLERDSIADPAAGLMVFNITDSCISFFDGIVWQNIGGTSVQTFVPVFAHGIVSLPGGSHTSGFYVTYPHNLGVVPLRIQFTIVERMTGSIGVGYGVWDQTGQHAMSCQGSMIGKSFGKCIAVPHNSNFLEAEIVAVDANTFTLYWGYSYSGPPAFMLWQVEGFQ